MALEKAYVDIECSSFVTVPACNHHQLLVVSAYASTQKVMQAANLLLMDSVAGVGYSYSHNKSDYNTSDSQAQTDMEATLREWFRVYPYFANHSVFLQGDTHCQGLPSSRHTTHCIA